MTAMREASVDVREYLTADGKNPYREWLDTLDAAPRQEPSNRMDEVASRIVPDLRAIDAPPDRDSTPSDHHQPRYVQMERLPSLCGQLDVQG